MAGKKFKCVINEWENEVPKLAFNSIGAYLLFYKSIFHFNGALAVRIIVQEPIPNIEEVYRYCPSEHGDWKNIEKVLYGSLLHQLIFPGSPEINS